MVAGPDACSCPQCETVCKGRFAGCADVWARGPQTVAVGVAPSAKPDLRAGSGASTAPATPTPVATPTPAAVPLLDLVVPHQEVKDQAPPLAPSGAPVVDRQLHDRMVAVVDQLAGRLRRLEATVDTVAITAASAAKTPRVVPDDKPMSATLDQLARKVQRLESAAAKAPVVAPAPPAPPPPPDNTRIDAVAKAMGGLAVGLDRLAAEVSGLRSLPDRLDALERRSQATPPSPSPQEVTLGADDLARLASQVEELTASVVRSDPSDRDATVTRLGERVDDLGHALVQMEAARQSQPAPPPDLSAEVQGLERRLEQVSARFTPLASLAEQVEALESGARSADDEAASALVQLTARVDVLASAVESLRPDPATEGRAEAIEKVVRELLRSTEELSAQLSRLDDVPKRLEALEAVEQPQLDKVVASMGKRLDRLATQVGELKTLPGRVRLVEDQGGRSESLTQGLRGAIDIIDELSAQVSAIQDGDQAGNGSTD